MAVLPPNTFTQGPEHLPKIKMTRKTKIPVVKTPSPAAPKPMTREQVEKVTMSWLTSQVERLETDVEQYLARFTGSLDPGKLVHNLEWSMGLFECGTKLAVYKFVLDTLLMPDTKATIESLHVYATQQAIDKCRFGSRSSSETANVTNRCTAAAWAQLAEDLRGWVASLQSADANYAPWPAGAV